VASNVPLTLLVLDPIGVPPYSARGLTQTYAPIGASTAQRRTVNGQLVDVSAPQMRKYATQISCTDQEAPALDGIYPGMTVTVDCIFELSFPTGGTPDRTVVPGSQRDADGFTFYRPRLTCMVTAISDSTDEWGASVNWQLSLEEI
jgi:hypothetical protein